MPRAWTYARRYAMFEGGSLHVVALWLMIAYCATPARLTPRLCDAVCEAASHRPC
jgi:hypothetical protein